MSMFSKYFLLVKSLPAEFSHLRIEPKAGTWYWEIIEYLLCALTLGYTDFFAYPTVVGPILALPENWGSLSIKEHLECILRSREWWRLYRKLGLGDLWIGFLVLVLLSLICPLVIPLSRRYVESQWSKQVLQFRISK